MKFRWEKKYLYWGITAFLVIVLSISFFSIINNFDVVAKGFGKLTDILMPLLLAFAFAYLLNPIVNFAEKKWTIPLFQKTKSAFSKTQLAKNLAERQAARETKAGENQSKAKRRAKSVPRALAILIALIFTLFVIIGLLVMVLPELVKSIIGIINSLPEYLNNLQIWATNLVESNPVLEQMLSTELNNVSNNLIEWARGNLLPQLNSILSGITAGVFSVVGVISDFLIGIIVSIYVLFSKELFAAQAQKVVFAIFPPKAGNVILTTTRRADKVFGGFIVGKLIDSAIIGVICFAFMSLFNLISPADMPFVMLISTIIAVTNIIPFFGPFIGAIPSILLILMINPLLALYFGIFVLLLQQFDGNILGPKILGNSTGLSAFWVMFAILLGGGLFGFMGMVLGVPTFAVIYTIIKNLIDARLRRLETAVES